MREVISVIRLNFRLASFWGAKCIIECGYHMCYDTKFCTFIKYEYTYLCIVLYLDVFTFSYSFLFRQNMHGIFLVLPKCLQIFNSQKMC